MVAATGTARCGVAGGACGHALRQAKEISYVVAAWAGTARCGVAGGACWHALRQVKEIG